MSKSHRGEQIVLASSNAGKVREINQLLAAQEIRVVPQREFGISEAEETGLSFVENATPLSLAGGSAPHAVHGMGPARIRRPGRLLAHQARARDCKQRLRKPVTESVTPLSGELCDAAPEIPVSISAVVVLNQSSLSSAVQSCYFVQKQRGFLEKRVMFAHSLALARQRLARSFAHTL